MMSCSSNEILLKIVGSSLKYECYFEKNIHLNDSLSHLQKLKLEKIEEYSIESQVFYDYGKYSIGFDTSLLGMHRDPEKIKIITINYKVDLTYNDIKKVLPEKDMVIAYWQYGTFLLLIDRDDIRFTFWPADKNGILEETMKKYKPYGDTEKLEKEIASSINKYSFNYLDVSLK
jgi:hypothetical protein